MKNLHLCFIESNFMKTKISPAIILLFSSLLIACKGEEEAIHPEYRPLTEAVYASGNLYPKEEYKVFSSADGTLLKQLVQEGDSVREGEVLFVLDNDVDLSRYEAAQTTLEIARENASKKSNLILELEATIETAGEKFSQDSTNLERYKLLWKKEAISKKVLEQAQLAYQASQNDLIALKQRLDRTKSQTQVELSNAESNYKAVAKSLSDHSPQSMINGKLYETYKEPGELIRRGELLALVGSGKDLYLKLSVDELDITRVHIGQEVIVRFDIQQNKVYKARVSKIYPKLNKADQSFRVDAVFEGESPESLYGLTLEANIIVAKKDKVLTIPRKMLIGADSLLVKMDGEEKQVKVEVGLKDWDYVEILSGVDTNTELIAR